MEKLQTIPGRERLQLSTVNCQLSTVNCQLLMRVQQFSVAFLKRGFGFIEQKFGKYPVIWEIQNEVPLGYIASGQCINRVNIAESFKLTYARTLFQSRYRRCQKPVLGFDKFG